MANVYNFFKFLEDKTGREIPTMAYILYNQEAIPEEGVYVDNLYIAGKRHINYLPNNMIVGSFASLFNSSIKKLPDNLTIGKGLDISYTTIHTIPQNLKIGTYLVCKDTPLGERYSAKEIRKMITDKGGYVKGDIIT